MSRYAKTILALVLSVSTWGTTAVVDGGIDGVEWFTLLGALATTLGVYLVPNTPPEGEPADPNMSELGP